jgi:hypothetical protein
MNAQLGDRPQDVPTLLDVDESLTPRAGASGQSGAPFSQHVDEQGQQQTYQRSGSVEAAGHDLCAETTATRGSAGLGRISSWETPPQ